ncbi:MAG: restriction endonuclease, partial [Myxococcales bacterium]|nr:restriction endonuclease [Myxococcales bacterium]
MAQHADWLALVERDGLVLSEPVLEQYLPDGPHPVNANAHHWFRRKAERFRVALADKALPAEKRAEAARQWIDYLLEELLEHPAPSWKKAGEVPDDCRVHLAEFDQELRADRLLVGPKGPALLVSIVPPEQGLDRQDRREGRWKASPTTKLERLLRETNHPLGLVTNGDDFRLLYAPPGFTAGHIGWTTRLLIEEKATLDAFHTLLGRDLLRPADESAHTLADLCRMSLDRQGEVADQLGEQVRNGLERLIWAWDAADRAASGELLRGIETDRIYEMGLNVMMRLVFLLYAEERNLLPHGEVLYDQGYGLTYLWHQLQREHREDRARMGERFDAWRRFLATCRLVHGGCGHPDLRLIAYGGRLFDPRRYPVLEDPRCLVSNRTFFEVLRLLLFARQRKGGEPQRVGYWAIDVEQIGYIYEGLLDHRCARAGDEPMVKLRGTGEAALPITELEQRSRDELVAFVAEATGRKAEAIREALETPAAGPADDECLAKLPPGVEERVRPFAGIVQCEEVVPPGRLYLTTGTSRRASGAHYTPQSLTERIVRTTLEPLVYRNVDGKPGLPVEPREVKSPRELLDLKVCDIAMGSGAFLVQVVRYLGDRLVEAWDRALAAAHERDPSAALSVPYADPLRDAEAERAIDPEHRDEMVLWARRYVVERCVYGVDRNPLAVEMAQLSLWLATLAKERPFTFLDHALRCGDSLVGVDREQLLSWSLDRKGTGAQIGTLEPLVASAVDEALDLRKQLARITVLEAADSERKAALLEKANRALERVRLAGDLVIAPSFAAEKAKEQAALREALLARFAAAGGEQAQAELRHDAGRMLAGQRTFHWPFEFPEVFLDGERGGFDAIVGNPPFVGGQFIRRQLGERMLGWLRERWPQSHGTADLVTFFFLRAFENVRRGGAFGLIATNTIGQGDTRESGLDDIVRRGGSIFAAVPRMPWPGQAAVNVSVVHVSRGPWHGPARLDDRVVPRISTSLDEAVAEEAPKRLAANAGKSFQGSNVLGLGFTMSPEEARALIAKDPRNAEVLFPYLNGKDLNTSPDQSPTRWVINFFDWPLEKAQQYPDCFAIVREKVYPERQAIKGTDPTSEQRRRIWWRFTRPTIDLYRTIAPLERVLVVARVTKYLAWIFVPAGWVYNEKTIILSDSSASVFTVLQANIHEAWARRYSST